MTDLFDLTGRVALVTGGAQGLGRMIAEGLLGAGATVVITSRKPEAVEAAAAEMAALGHCIPLVANLASADGAAQLAKDYSERVGRCHILINNAGKSWGAPLESFPDKAWSDVMTINVQVPFTLVRELLPLLRASGTPDNPSRVINVGSVAGSKIEGLSAYSYTASKAAVHMLTRDLAATLAGDNVTVNALVPGYFPTRMTAHMRDADGVNPEALEKIPLRRFGTATDIAGAAIFLCSRAGSYLTGCRLPVDGGILGCA